jgi:L-threonylcarbamoyladenylate synthase
MAGRGRASGAAKHAGDRYPRRARIMELVPTSPDGAADDPALRRAAERLRAGGLVAFPTETVYGLGAHALDEDAVARIYAAKGRPAHNPVIVHVADAQAARSVVAEWTPHAELLARRFWPGPLTLVLPKSAKVPASVVAGLDKVGVRVPAHPVALALLRAAQVPVAAPSANRSNEVSPTTARHVVESLGAADVLVLDGGACGVGIESTVIDVSGARPVLLRPGGVARDELERVLGMAVATAHEVAGDAPRAAPGMLRKHYATRAPLALAPHGDLAALRARLAVAPPPRAALVFEASARGLRGEPRLLAMPDDPRAYARRLYAALRELDAHAPALIVVESPPPGVAWEALRDRLSRAAAGADDAAP